MRYSVFEVELWDGAAWDFGPVEYSNITMVRHCVHFSIVGNEAVD